MLVLLLCLPLSAQQPITDGNGDGIVDLTDFSNLATDWLGAGYAGLESNCRIDVGFYTGDSSQEDAVQQIPHYLGRIPNFIIVFPLSPTYNIVPATIILDGTETKFKSFNSRDCDVFTSGDVMAYNEDIFKIRNISADQSYWLNKTDGRYMYVAVSQEIPAMQMMSLSTPSETMESVIAISPTITTEALTKSVVVAEPVAVAEAEEEVTPLEEKERLCLLLADIEEWISETDDDDTETLATLNQFKADIEQDIATQDIAAE